MSDASYSNLLVPTDGSELAFRAVEEALTVAGLADATIHVLYVIDDAEIAGHTTHAGVEDISFDADVDQLFERFEAVGEHAIDDVREAADERGVNVVTAIRKGLPRDEILSYVEENGIDLIVMGTHGRRGLQRYVLGSTTEEVLRRAAVPVLAVRGGSNDG